MGGAAGGELGPGKRPGAPPRHPPVCSGRVRPPVAPSSGPARPPCSRWPSSSPPRRRGSHFPGGFPWFCEALALLLHSFPHPASTRLLNVYYDPGARCWVPASERTHGCPGVPSQKGPRPGGTCRQVRLLWALCANLCSPVWRLACLPTCGPCGPLHLWVRVGRSQGSGTTSPPSRPRPRRPALPADTRGRCGLAVTSRGLRSRRALQRGTRSCPAPRPDPAPQPSAPGRVGGGGAWGGWAQNSRGPGRGCYSRPGRAALAACPAGRGLGRDVPAGALRVEPRLAGRPHPSRPSRPAPPAPSRRPGPWTPGPPPTLANDRAGGGNERLGPGRALAGMKGACVGGNPQAA